MRRICAAVWAAGLCAAAASAAQPRITLLSPSGGEYCIEGQQQTVSVNLRVKKVTVELSRDGGTTFEKLGTIDSAALELNQRTSLQWTVMPPASTNCLVRVTDGVNAVTSGMFTIVALQSGTGANVKAEPAVTTTNLSDASVTTAKLADGAVTTLKLANHAVRAEKIDSTPASADFVLTADGGGGATWQPVTSIVPGAPPVGAAGGDLAGNYPSPQIAATAGNSLIAAINNAATTSTLNPARLPVAGTAAANPGGVYADTTSIAVAPDGKLSAVASGITLNGDVTGAADSNAIAPGAVTGAKIANTTITSANLAGNIGISTAGAIATTGSGKITSAGLLTANNGLKVTGTVSLPNNSVADTALSSNVALLNAANTFTTGPQTLKTGNDANRGLVVKGNSATQSADLQQWQNSSASVLVNLTSNGNLGLGTTAPNEQLEIANPAGARMIASNAGGANRQAVLLQGPGALTYGRINAYNFGTSTGMLLALNDLGQNVAINDPTSFGALTATGTASGGNASAAAVYNNANYAAGASASLDFLTNSTSNGGIAQARIAAVDDGNSSAHLSFGSKNQGAGGNPVNERMRLTSTGNLYLVPGGPVTTTPTLYVGQSIDTLHGFTVATSGASAGTALILQSGSSGSIAYTPNGGASYPFFINNTGQGYLAASLGVATTNPSTNARLALADGHLQSQQTTAPTIAVNGLAGTGGTASLSNATDVAGTVSLTTGTAAWGVGTQLTVTFNKGYAVAPIVTLTPSNANAADTSRKIFVNTATNNFTVKFGVADTSSKTYTWTYHVIETQ